jgi:hypothetical protein
MKLILILLLLLSGLSPLKPSSQPTSGEKPPLVSPLTPITHPSLIEKEEFVSKKPIPIVVRENVIFTNYYLGDGSSGTTTSSGLQIRHFKVNSMGWYTYQGKVVVATATTICLRVKTGPCGKYNSVPDGYRVYDLRDELTIIFNGKAYEAIVLDSCGACMHRINNEPYQRYDIFIKSNRFGRVQGQIEVTLE